MAQVFKQTYTKPVPADAEIVTKTVTRNGVKSAQRFVRFKQRSGRTITAPLTDDGQRYQLESKKYYGRYRDADDVLQKVPLATDKDAAETMLVELKRKAERQRQGMVDPFEDHRKRPLSEHLADFRRHLEAKGNSPKHVKQTCYRVQSICDGCGFDRLADIQAHRVAAWLADERDAEHIGIKTSNYYLAAMKQFGTWLAKERRWPENTLDHLTGQNPRTDVRRERRSADPEEFRWLIETTSKSSRSFRGLSGEDRVMLYLTAAYGGLRANELASLTPGSFDFDGETPTVTIEAAYSKRRRMDVQPLRPDVAATLQGWLDCRDSDDNSPLWPGTWIERAARMLRKDLSDARKAWLKTAPNEAERQRRERSDILQATDSDGRVFDFHALRHHFISSLAAAGVHPKTAQQLARHSTITLTMDRYTHLSVRDMAGALDELPNVPSSSPNRPETSVQLLRATGTDHDSAADANPKACHFLVQADGRACPPMSETSGNPQAESIKEERPKPHENKGLDRSCPPISGESESSGGGTRTPDTRIMIPLL